MKRERICLGIPCFGDVPPQILEDYMRFAFALGRRYQEWDFILGVRAKSEQFRARNNIIEGSLATGCKYTLMLDDDQLIDSDAIVAVTNRYDFLKLLLHHMEWDETIGLIGALYFQTNGGFFPVLMHEKGTHCTFLRDEEISGALQEVDVQGGGCMLIRNSVFEHIPSPWFEAESAAGFGTDIQICRKIRAAGFRICCDTSIELGHLPKEKVVVTKENVQALRAATLLQLELQRKGGRDRGYDKANNEENDFCRGEAGEADSVLPVRPHPDPSGGSGGAASTLPSSSARRSESKHGNTRCERG